MPEGADDDGVDRGVFFMAMNANLADQFEFLQSTWLQSGSFTGLDSDEKDPVVGDNEGQGMVSITMPDGTKKRLFSLPQFVTLRFGAYVFLPSIKALQWIAAGAW